MTDCFGDILIPAEEVKEVSRGKPVTRDVIFPGYMLVQMDMTDAAWPLLLITPKLQVS